MPPKKEQKPRTDRSATARLVHDFGLLLIKGDFERYLDERPLLHHAILDGRLDEHVPLDERHMLRFVPLLKRLGIHDLGRNPHLQHFEEIERLQQIEAFLQAYKLTVDFSLQVSELRKRLKRKFDKNPTALTLPYKTKKLISDDLVNHCRDLMWVVEEFHVESNDGDIDDVLWDVNIWTVILDADRLHREQGRVHLAFFQYLSAYQGSKGDGSPRTYLRTAMTVLLAECFEDFDRKKREPQIHDKSDTADKDQYGKTLTNRISKYDSAFADFLIEFIKITTLERVPQKSDNSLDHYRTISRLRVDRATPRISCHLKSSTTGAQVADIIHILDCLKF